MPLTDAYNYLVVILLAEGVILLAIKIFKEVLCHKETELVQPVKDRKPDGERAPVKQRPRNL
jgi:hypothetical protein